MKINASIFTKYALGLAIAASISACNQGKNAAATTAPATSTNTTTPDSKETIVFINSDTLSSKYQAYKDMSNRLEVKGKAAQADVAAKGQAFQREVADYQKAAATLSADQRQTTEQRLQREQQSLQTYQQNAAAEFQSEQSTENGKLYNKVADFVKIYAKEKGYKLVLTYSKTNPNVLYGDTTLDVTADVVKQLNDAYTKDNGK
jgi:outer membrane protein